MKKKILCVVLAATMAFSCTACGSKKSKVGGNDVKVTVEEVNEKMGEAMKDIKALDVKMAVDFDAKVSAQGEEISAKIKGDADIAGGLEAKGGKAEGNITYDVKGVGEDTSGSYEGKAYLEVEDEKINVYYTIDGKSWFSASTAFDEAMKAFEDAASQYGLDSDTLKDAIENGDTSAATDATADIPELKPTIGGKTVEAAGKECYEISSVVTKDVMKKLPGMEEQLTNIEMFDEITAKAAMYVDVKTNLPVKFAVSADMKVNEEMAQGVKMDIKACEFSMELNYDNVDVKVPSDVKEKAIAIN